ncbi:MAG: DNA mismatch repair endonuclease MutL [Phycisphaerales bacterium]
MTGAPASPPLLPTIRALPALVVNQIAAGEVVERPASIVKELIDNALDAGATRIALEIEQGGIELIRVSDDGHGIPLDQLALALAPHATSKLADSADLDRIATMGFRGEALASIASVSRLSIRSRTAAQPAAAVIEAEGDRIGPALPASGPVGSVVTVKNLFFNTPARRKFLRTPATEQAKCIDMLTSLAMSHPAIAFTATCDGRTNIDLPPGQSPRERLVAVLGNELQSELIEVSADDNGPPGSTSGPLTLWGLVGRPSIARATAQAQHVFVNGRPIRDRSIMHALKEAFRGLLDPHRYPTGVLLIEVPPDAVDVNVHPTKAEVRFREPSRMHSLVLRSVRDALQRADLTPAISGNGFGGGGFGSGGFGPRGVLPPVESAPAGTPTSRFTDYFTREIPAQTGGRLSYDDVRRAVAGEGADGGGGQGQPGTAPANMGTHVDHSAGEPSLLMPRPSSRVLQVHNSFLVTQDEQGMVIIDQHALHERVMFEKLLARVGAQDAAGSPAKLESQRLLTPAIVPVSPAQADRLADLTPLLERIGIAAAPLGPTTLGVHAFPTFLFDRGVDPVEFLSELFDKAEATGFTPQSEEALHEVLDMMACKAAIKAGDHLSDTELGDILAMRDRIERSSNCPHGRPTSIRLTVKELEKRFGRT